MEYELLVPISAFDVPGSEVDPGDLDSFDTERDVESLCGTAVVLRVTIDIDASGGTASKGLFEFTGRVDTSDIVTGAEEVERVDATVDDDSDASADRLEAFVIHFWLLSDTRN